MAADRLQQVSGIYHAALARDAGDRDAFLRDACTGDDALRREVESLLAHEHAAAPLIETPALEVAAQIMNKSPEDGASLVGRQMGPYTLLSLLGTGGMGKVYRARDTKLGRDVAIKLLPSEFTADADRRTRFEREARLLAALNHPHIAQIYGLEESDGVQALVMELVEGRTLDEIINGARASGPGSPSDPTRTAQRRVPDRRPLSLDRALAIARQIADALEAAHEKGIIHRDLKPANIKVTPDGTVKVLDFGLAKAITGDAPGPDLSQLPTLTQDGTRQGMMLGTPAYMSPEQARGQPVDKRTDIWAFGCVLYEMLAGRHAFAGDSLQDTLAAVLTREPDLDALSPDTPAPVRALLRHCLQKDPRHRWHDIADARIEIDDRDLSAATSGDSQNISAARIRRRERLAWITAALVGVAFLGAVGVGFFYLRQLRPAADPTEFIIVPPEHSSFDVVAGLAISPDGRNVAFVDSGKVWVRPLGSVASQPLPGTEAGLFPFWSPDSRSLGFIAGAKLKKVEVRGGTSVELCDAQDGGGTWNRDNVILFGSRAGPLQKVSSGGGTPTPVTTMGKHETSHRFPWFLPDGQHFLYLAVSGDRRELRVGSLASSDTASLGPAESNAVYGAGHLLFLRGGNLMAQPFDVDRNQLTGDPVLVAGQIFFNDVYYSGAFSTSTAGVLGYLELRSVRSQLTWMDRAGRPLGDVGDPGAYCCLSLSPDEQHVAVSSVTGSPPRRNIWVLDLNRAGAATRITFGPGAQWEAVWSPNGTQLIFNSNQTGPFSLFRHAADGGGQDELVVKSDTNSSAPDWSRDGRFLVYAERGLSTAGDLWTVPLSADGKPGTPSVFLQTPYNEWYPAFSPDGHWIAYTSNASGREEVYVRPFPVRAGQLQISRDGGRRPKWRGDSHELFFVALDGTLMSASLDAATGLHATVPQPLFKTKLTWNLAYAVAKDGKRFLLDVDEPSSSPSPITVVVNWPATIHK